ncbi:MAG: helix-turn-helix transcriptional regulator [Caulobacteraceae bacterium]
MHAQPYLTASQVCARLGLSRTTLYDLVKRQVLAPPIKFGRASRWSLAELEACERALATAR